MNHLEQIVAEWYEYNGYFVRRNIKVGKRPRGGYEGELDVVAFHPDTGHLVHVEPSLDADSWAKREQRYTKKFEAGRKYIPKLFAGVTSIGKEIDQIALFLFGSRTNVKQLAGGRVAVASDFFSEVARDLETKRAAKQAVPEQFALLRTVQFTLEFVFSGE
jgi:hypothetical protein